MASKSRANREQDRSQSRALPTPAEPSVSGDEPQDLLVEVPGPIPKVYDFQIIERVRAKHPTMKGIQ